ncbi:LPXTG cell wall anchor domain-containing protein [Kribbella pittospori]|uniref:LPXTG cell wall anchor domain-containing protein n=1 Tax=Kribbella pittospori TaxID=722689 RepID=A0A4R0JFZ8_9ACTN|nr:LPXTG cell wall anchor domain-containing protein [Kribbella pittospori]TCC45389.1 LPXTG cell wall anchor domain-containing protein [Kribbella pittospori]
MNHARTAIAATALGLIAVTLGATNAAATHPAENGTLPAPAVTYGPPDCHWAYHPSGDAVPVPEPPVQAALGPSDDTGAETMQAGASALGGACLALTGVWIYRRRHALNSMENES